MNHLPTTFFKIGGDLHTLLGLISSIFLKRYNADFSLFVKLKFLFTSTSLLLSLNLDKAESSVVRDDEVSVARHDKATTGIEPKAARETG